MKAPAVKRASNSSNSREQEIRPIIIDDIQATPDSPEVDNQQNDINTKIPTTYPQKD